MKKYKIAAILMIIHENKVLDTFLYEAIFIPEGVPAPSKDIINQPELQV